MTECNADLDHRCDAGDDGEMCAACQRYMANGLSEAAEVEEPMCVTNNCGDPVVADGLCRACLATQARFERAAKGAS